jgi:Protein of unknown function (DUF3311)
MTPRVAALLVSLLYLLHQDFWFWRTAEPIVFGVLPIGLAYHVGYMLVTVALLAWLVARLWPAHLEGVEDRSPRS